MYKDPAAILDSLDVDEQMMLITCLLNTLEIDTIYKAVSKTKDILEANGRQDAARALEEICYKLLDK